VPAEAQYLPSDFSDPWEHIRLLSDRARNDALVRMLQRRAPGARVLEVGCGTGLLSCVAAKLGASHVFAVEQTKLAEQAKQLVVANDLQDRVTVIHGSIEDLEPQPADLVFSELLNADPFYEGVMPAMEAAARWLAPGGTLSPRRLKIYVALAWASEPSEEFAAAMGEVTRIGGEVGLRLDSLLQTLDARHPMRWVSHAERPVSTVACAFDLPIGSEALPPLETQVVVWSRVEGAVGGALVWFSAEVDDDLWMSGHPLGADGVRLDPPAAGQVR
jgi:SAM-dependent methyltransferase